ncbi:MAG: DNA helicase RecQ [Spirochaetaceae bacterium]|nr:DNA helicase RecQ [Spirochaetaceae bacterium]
MGNGKYQILKDCFGYTEFRGGQEEIIDAVLTGRDALGIMPTGAGKSLCYQIPALLLEGITVVISPLISLMKDQVNALVQAGVKAAFINSSLTSAKYDETLRRAVDGGYRILYIAPERLLREDMLRFAETADIAMVTVDEAHCVSQWGHDFRPSYLKIREFAEHLKKRPVISAFTATATERVREDIVTILGLENPCSITTGFDRGNLFFSVQRPERKLTALTAYIEKHRESSGIIYCSTRKLTEEVCSALTDQGFPATRYHAGLDDRERHRNQDDFLYDRRRIMVATNAFGMGIDKSNVSFVIHYNMPKNIESYYQEAGRAGRDGSNADCILFYSPQDVRLNKFLIENSQEESDSGGNTTENNLELLKQMTFYCTTSGCLRSFILRYFGETAPHYCGHCSNCTTLFETCDITIDAQKIISCVYRIARQGRSFGKIMIVNILKGSKNAKLIEAGMDNLSTYGIMAEQSAQRIRSILDYLIEQNYLSLDTGEYPVVRHTPRSAAVLRSEEAITMMLPREPEHREKPAVFTEAPADEKLFLKLKKLRNTLAQDAHVPAYIVFADSALRDMCRKLPQTSREFLEVSGVGRVKMEQYGEFFTKAIREYVAENGEN